MPTGQNRRNFLQILLAGTGLAQVSAAWAAPGSRQTLKNATSPAKRPALAATASNERVTLISGAGGNVLVVRGDDGVAMVNGGAAERSRDLLTLVAERTGNARVHTLFNTDWHPLHTGSNEALAKTGTTIIAHENTKQYLANDQYVDWQNRSFKALPRQALPSKPFYTTGKMTVGSESLVYGHLGQAHTDGDIYVFLPDSNVVMVGDVLTVGQYPIADHTSGGWLGGLANATKTLINMTNADTRVIPGEGPVQTRADLQAQHDMLTAVRDRLVKMMKQGMGAEDMLAAAATKDFDAK